MVIKRLQHIGEGQWEMDGGTEMRLAEVRYASLTLLMLLLQTLCTITEQTQSCLSIHPRCVSAWLARLTIDWMCRGLEVYRTLLTRGGRIVFEVAVDYSQTANTWKEMLRLWVSLQPCTM